MHLRNFDKTSTSPLNSSLQNTIEICIWCGWMWIEKRQHLLGGLYLRRWQKKWCEIICCPPSSNTNQLLRESHVFFFMHKRKTNSSWNATPSKILIIDVNIPAYQSEGCFTATQHFLHIRIKGNCGRFYGLKDGMLRIAVESEEDAKTVLTNLDHWKSLDEKHFGLDQPVFRRM